MACPPSAKSMSRAMRTRCSKACRGLCRRCRSNIFPRRSSRPSPRSRGSSASVSTASTARPAKACASITRAGSALRKSRQNCGKFPPKRGRATSMPCSTRALPADRFGAAMSKAFTRESDPAEEDAPESGPSLPAGAKNYITPEGFARLREELRQLSRVERPKIVETVAWAAGNGDRSENGDYIYGKQRLREIDRRLRFLTKRLEIAEVVDP